MDYQWSCDEYPPLRAPRAVYVCIHACRYAQVDLSAVGVDFDFALSHTILSKPVLCVNPCPPLPACCSLPACLPALTAFKPAYVRTYEYMLLEY